MAKNLLFVFFILLVVALCIFLIGIGIIYLLRIKNSKIEQMKKKYMNNFKFNIK